MIIRAPARAAPSEFAVDDNGRNTSDAVLLRFGSHIGLLHILDHNLMRRPSKTLNYLDCFLARRTTCTEDFDFLFCSHGVSWTLPYIDSSHYFSLAFGPESTAILV